MKIIDTAQITELVEKLCIEANKHLPEEVETCLHKAVSVERNTLASSVLCELEKNLDAAKEYDIPICQDTGMAVVFVEIGQEVQLTGKLLSDAINEGVRRGYQNGLLRKSVVADPLRRINTNDNTPAVIHTELIAGDEIRITVAPKGFGSENMSGIRMLTPHAGRQGVIDTVIDIVKQASNNPCPPMVIGVGIGGDFEQCALLAKKALCRDGSAKNNDVYYAELENELLQKINRLNIGPQGFGGDTTAFFVNIEAAPTHIAGLPVAVNIGCHVTRHARAVIK